MRLYLVVDRSLPDPIEVHLCREDAELMVADVLKDEPGWRSLLSVRPVEVPDAVWQLTDEDRQPSP